MKNTKKWLDMLPEDIRKKAIKAHKKTGYYNKCEECKDIADFIVKYFCWDGSGEEDYWSEIYDRAIAGEFDKIKDLHTENVRIPFFDLPEAPPELFTYDRANTLVTDPITNNEIGKSGSASFGTGTTPLGSTVPPILFQQSLEPIIPKQKYDYINPYHYKNSSKEVIDMMKDIWGKDDLIKYCEMCSFKYRMRLGLKPGQSVDQDLEKARWYESKAKELRNGR